jgi:hypothetical protein
MMWLANIFLIFLAVFFVYAAWSVSLAYLGQAGERAAQACRRLIGRC